VTPDCKSIKAQEVDMSTVEKLSDAQEKVLAILPIPSALLSIFGSSVIIYMAVKTRRKHAWTPYTRLLLAMSIYDIIFSGTIGVASFLRPQETSTRIWAFGNNASCGVIGFLNQLSTSAILYNAMLSLYFLLTARFGLKNAYIAKRIEPLMHFVAVFYPAVTATVGALEGAYGEMAVNGLVCWLVSYPRNCGNGPGESGEECRSMLVAWMFYGVPVVLTLACLIVNNLIIVVFVRKQTRIRKARSANARRTTSSDSRHQHRRLKLVSSQASLFVASFTVCIVWSGIMNSADRLAETEEDEMEMMSKFYPISVIQAILLPLQGLFNMLVYLRPKILKSRHEYPEETKLWATKRSIFGDAVKPTYHGTQPLTPSPGTLQQKRKVDIRKESEEFRMPDINSDEMVEENDVDHGSSDLSTHDSSHTGTSKGAAAFTRLPRDTVSSLTASIGDFDHINSDEMVEENDVDHGSSDLSTHDSSHSSKGAAAFSRLPRDTVSSLTASIGDFDYINSDEMVKENDVDHGSSDLSTHDSSHTSKGAAASFTRLPRDTVSSLTASIGDFDHVIDEDEEDKRWKDLDRQGLEPMRTAPRFKSSLNDGIGSSLESISELSESVFESIETFPEIEEEEEFSSSLFLSPDQSEGRWSASGNRNVSVSEKNHRIPVSSSLNMPRRIDSDFDKVDSDSPVRRPSRKLSPSRLIR
jgi:hypothetical protein